MREAGGPPAEPVALDDALDDALEALQARLSETDAQVRRDAALPSVCAHRAQLARVLQNLVSNAMKFAKDGERPEIAFAARRGNGTWEIDVSDRGVGFEPALADRIFAPFRTAHDRRRYPGSGVGLALCQRIVEHYGGSITARSVPGKGATFTLRFPAAT